MVISKRLPIYFAGLLTFLSLSVAAAADKRLNIKLPTTTEVQTLAVEISENIQAFDKSSDKKDFLTLRDNLQKFKSMIAYTGQSVNRDEGGAVTKTTDALVDAVSNYGVDIANALFVLRTKNGEKLAKAGLEQDFEDIMVNELEYPLLQMAFSVARHKVDEKSGVDGRVTVVDVFSRTFMEVGRDIVSLFWGGKNRVTDEMFYTPVESMRREALSRRLIERYRQYSTAHIPEFNKLYDGDLNYDRERHEESLGGLLIWLTDRTVNIRVERDSAQRYARFSYAITGLVLGQPFFNFLGDSYSAHAETSIMVISAFAAMYVLKAAASSTLSTRQWLAFNQQVRSEMAPGLVKSTEIHLEKEFPAEYHPAQVPGWIQRRVRIHNAIDAVVNSAKNQCNRILGKELFKAKATKP